jgi:hypothetical protein
MKRCIAQLPLILEKIPLFPRLTRLTVEAKNIVPASAPYPFEGLVNAYLSHLHLSQNLVHLELRATFRPFSRATRFMDWISTDGLLSDEGRFPNLKTIRLVFTETLWHLPEPNKKAMKNGLLARKAKTTQAIRNAFDKSERRGFNLEVDLKYELE